MIERRRREVLILTSIVVHFKNDLTPNKWRTVMCRKIILRSFIVIAVIMLTIGCSNTNSPMSVSSDNTSTVAYLANSPQTWEVVAAGPTQLWAKSLTPVSGSENDYYIYKYFTESSSWANTGHYGKAITVSPSGKCYHINASNGIWWGDGYGNWGQITNGSDIVNIKDITVCNLYSGCDQLWILGTNSLDNTLVRRCTITNTTVTWDMANPVYVPAITNYTPVKISRDPSDSRYAVIIYDYNSSPDHQRLYATSDYGHTWTQQASETTTFVDAAICGTNVAFTYFGFWGSYVAKGTINGDYNDNSGVGSAYSVAIDYDGNNYNIYTLDGNYRVEKATF
jgi:hypothetical protein